MMTKMMLLTLCLLAAASVATSASASSSASASASASASKVQCGCQTKDSSCASMNWKKAVDGNGDMMGNTGHCANQNRGCKAGEPKCMCDTAKFGLGGKCTAYATCAMNCKAEKTVKPTTTNKPTPGKIHVVEGEINFTGIDDTAFDAKGKAALKTWLASSLSICGTKGISKCTADDVKIDSITNARRAQKKCTVKFHSKTTSAEAAQRGAKGLVSLLSAHKIAASVAHLKSEAKSKGATGLVKFGIAVPQAGKPWVRAGTRAGGAVAGAVRGAAMAAPIASLVSLAGATLAML